MKIYALVMMLQGARCLMQGVSLRAEPIGVRMAVIESIKGKGSGGGVFKQAATTDLTTKQEREEHRPVPSVQIYCFKVLAMYRSSVPPVLSYL